MPLVQTRGAASAQGFGEFAQVSVPIYIENLFSTYLYTGTNAAQTITNGIDLSTEGGLVWMKCRSAARSNTLCDTARGRQYYLVSNSTDAQQGPSSASQDLTAFNSNGFSLGENGYVEINNNGDSFVSWTFRKQAKFFDIVTYTGDGIVGRTVAHNLGVVPGCIIVKRTNTSGTNWRMYHQSLGATYSLQMNTTAAATALGGIWDNTEPTSTVFSVGNNGGVNASGDSYVAYLFAHNAGGFGLTGTDNVISCGTFTTDGSGNATVSLGYEPQWLLTKSTDLVDQWYTLDSMRGWPVTTASTKILGPNSVDAETTGTFGNPTATGFTLANGGATKTYIYVACRRGPMKVPTSGTSVFSPIAYTGNSTTNTTVQNLTTSFAGDAVIIQQRTSGNNPLVFDKLRGKTQALYTSLTSAEQDINAFRAGESVGFNNTQTVLTGQFTANGNYNYSGDTFVGWNFKRAPSFFDEVCYTGTGSARTVTHNLAAVPEMMIVKVRDSATNWTVYSAALGNNYYTILNSSDAPYTSSVAWNNTTPTSSVFTVGTNIITNGNGYLYVAYLFATCAGVSKVGSYTGNGSSQTINCGFTGGARFVMVKATSTTGNWIVADSARGIVAGNDPALYLNSTAAEVTGLDWIDADNSGFIVNETATIAANTNGVSYIFFAVA